MDRQITATMQPLVVFFSFAVASAFAAGPPVVPIVPHLAPVHPAPVHPAPVLPAPYKPAPPPPYHPAPVHPAPYKPAPHPAPYKPAPHPAPYHPDPYDDTPKPYSYEYGVHDEYSGTNFNAHEVADGKAVSGSYQVHLPDGRVQTVTYTADHYTGYVADVKYDGQAVYPKYEPKPYAPAPHKPAPYHPAPHKPAPYHPAPAPYHPAPAPYHPPVVPKHPAPTYKPVPVHPLPYPAPLHI